MPIKQIQLRGISRTPSDRASADGGCAESLNVHLDQGETAPTLPPDDISEDIYGGAVIRLPIVYVHKMLGTTNYIGNANGTFRAYGSKLPAEGDNMDNTHVVTGETLQHISSIGNTLIAYTDKKPYYFLFKDGGYHFLGSEIPQPQIEVITRPSERIRRVVSLDVPEGALRTASTSEGHGHPNFEAWNDAKTYGNNNHTELLAAMQEIWNELSLLVDNRRQDGIFAAPFFLRYGVRLYDKKYIHVSPPILCGGAQSDWMFAFLSDTYNNPTAMFPYEGYRLCVGIQNLFKVRIKGTYDVSNWGDIVESIDFFVSSPIYTPAIESGFFKMADTVTEFNVTERPDNPQTRTGLAITFVGMEDDVRNMTIKEEVLSKGQFFKIISLELNDVGGMSKLASGEFKIEASDDVSGEKLATHDTLQDTYRDSIQYLPKNGVVNYNNRILLQGADEILSRGFNYLNGLVSARDGASTLDKSHTFIFRFKIFNNISGETSFVLGRQPDTENNRFAPGFFVSDSDYDLTIQYYYVENVSAGPEALYHNSLPYAWIAYPDSRCVEVEVYFYINGVYDIGRRIPMSKHPQLQCAYAFLGFGKSLLDVRNDNSYVVIARMPELNESRTFTGTNKLLLSEFENPFLFPAGNIITFPDNVVGTAMTSAPLSEGQVGDFDMYVFTEGGIRVLSVNNEGTFSGNNVMPTNLSRHVALPGTITPLEQAVVFTTERGVMLLTRSQVTELSRNMNGKPYAFEEDIETVLGSSPWSDIIPATFTEETIMSFMRNAKVAYDNNGARLIFFNPDKTYQYVYMFETQTWHKIFTGVTNPKILNSYPDCLISHVINDNPEILNFSTVLDDIEHISDTENSVKGIIVTRPFDLGEPDIRKAITNVRIRGQFNRNDVQYILLGSFDGIHWQRLHSLRGGSYKLFRMILLCNLAPMERITWIDVEYESRFTNRLR